MKKEWRVYALPYKHEIFNGRTNAEVSDDEFIEAAANYGEAWTLKAFEDQWNNGSNSLDPRYSFIRILEVETYE